jgi:predicted chitinase
MPKHRSEWASHSEYQSFFEKVLRRVAREPYHEAEMERLKQLVWWDEVQKAVKGAFPASPEVFHIQPVALVGNFSGRQYRITVPFLEKITGESGYWFEGKRSGRPHFQEHFREAYPNVYRIDKNLFVDMINSELDKWQITSLIQQAHFLSQIFVECNLFDSTEEYASGNRYNPGEHSNAIAIENSEFGDGPKYKGRGLLQLTWKRNYRLYSEAVGRPMYYVDNYLELSADMKAAIGASCWYWRNKSAVSAHNCRGDINKLIEAEPFNVTLITRAVNGGTNGLADRQRIFNKIVQEWGLNNGQ